MINYYEILEISPQADPAQVKRAYRQLVKRYHPDRHRSNVAWAERKIRTIIEAYRVLSDPEKRLLHNHALRVAEPKRPDVFEELRSREDDPLAQSCIILHDLLHGNSERALENYERMRGLYADYDLLPYLSMRDYLDCQFLLGEAYEQRGDLEEAVEFYHECYLEERELPRLRYFFDEVKERLKRLCSGRLPRKVSPERALDYYRIALDIAEQPRENATILKKMAECHIQLCNAEAASNALDEAVRCSPRLEGIDKLRSAIEELAAAR